MILSFNIKEQLIERSDEEVPVTDSVNYLKASFTFSSDWSSCGELIAIFNGYKVLLETYTIVDSVKVYECVVPSDALDKPTLVVSVYGLDTTNEVRITTNKNFVNLKVSGFVDYLKTSSYHSEDIIEQILEKLDVKYDNVVLDNNNVLKFYANSVLLKSIDLSILEELEDTKFDDVVVDDFNLKFYANDVLVKTIALSGISTVTWNNVTDKPSTFPPSEHNHTLASLTDDATHRTVSDTQITNWNNKVDDDDLSAVATTGSYNDLSNKPTIPSKTSQLTNDSNFVSDNSYIHTDNNYTNSEKTKLSGLVNYDDTEVKADIIALEYDKQDKLTASTNIQINSDNEISATDTTYSDATTSTSGLMSKEDKVKLNGIENGANKYTLPIASDGSLGGIKVGNNLSIDEDGKLNAQSSYSLPTASATTKGGVKIGNNLSMNGEVLNAIDTTYSDATTTNHGLLSTTDKIKLDGLENYDDTKVKSDIENIESKIPSQATSSNQLGDKSFINSSISTATATFRGTYTTVAEIESIVTKDLNDYAFLKVMDSVETGQVKQYDRYKYNGSAWIYEYTLNNSSFTSTQWASINSGLTSASLDEYSTTAQMNTAINNHHDSTKADSSHNHDSRYYTESETDELLDGKANSSHTHDGRYYTETEVDDLLSNKSDTSHNHDNRYYKESEVNDLLDAKQDIISDLSTIRTGASKGNTSVQPLDNISTLTNDSGFVTNSYHDSSKSDVGHTHTLGSDVSETVHNRSVSDTQIASWTNKQDVISDLDTIRANAVLGATALQDEDVSDVALSGSYSDLSDTPSIPSKTSDLTNDSDFITTDYHDSSKSDVGHIHDDRYYTETETNSLLNGKVDKVNGKGLSTVDFTDTDYHHTDNNYTSDEKTKLESLENYDDTDLKSDIQDLQNDKVDKVEGKGLSTIDFTDSNYVHTDNNYTSSEKTKLQGLSNYDDTEVKTDISTLEKAMNSKVDKIEGKGLSKNDFTDDLKSKLDGLSNYDDTAIQSSISTINSKIPSEATSSNQLADKSFVSSEVSTHNSATDSHSTLFSNKNVTLTESTGTGDVAKIYTISQGSSEVGKINIPRDLVVKEGSIVEEEGVKYLKLVLTNDSVVKINVADLCDVYKADGVTLSINDDNTFSIKEGYLSTVATTGSYSDLSNTPNLSTVATSGSYNDLSNKPTIPTTTSQLINNSDFVSDASYVHTDENYSTGEKTKLSKIEAEANKTIVDSALDESSSNPVQNKVINSALSDKVDKITGKGLSTVDFTDTDYHHTDNNYTTDEKDKLASLVNYTLPTASETEKGGVKVGSNLNINGEVLSAVDTTYEDATTSTHGLMSTSDKTKLDGVDDGANKYELPIASDSSLGGVKVGSNLSIIKSTGVLSAVDTTYTVATTSTDGLMGKDDKSKLDGIVIANYELVSNKVSSIDASTTSTESYPTVEAVVDYIQSLDATGEEF